MVSAPAVDLGTHQKSLQNTRSLCRHRHEGYETALDQAMVRSLSPDDAAAWAKNNERWRNMKRVENASATAGEHLSPAGVAQSMRSGRAGQYASSSDELDELARAGARCSGNCRSPALRRARRCRTCSTFPVFWPAAAAGRSAARWGREARLPARLRQRWPCAPSCPVLVRPTWATGWRPAACGTSWRRRWLDKPSTQGDVQRRSAAQRKRDEEAAAAELRRQRLTR